jgi:parallel beta-helix repeat protein
MEVEEMQKISGTSSLPSELVFCGVFPIVMRPDAGPDRRDGFYIAVDEINNQTGAGRILPSGVSIKAIALDDQNNVAGGTAAANTCNAQGAHIVIGSSGSSVSAAMQDVLKTIPIIQISYASSSPTLSDRTAYPYFMRVSSSDLDQGFALIDLVDSFGFTKGALINTFDTYGSGTPSVFLNNWTGSIITHQTYAPSASDVSSQVQALKDAVDNDGVEFIHLSAIDVDARTVIKEAFNVGLTNNKNVTFIINDGSVTTATFFGDTDVENGMQNMLGTTTIGITGPNYQTFIDTWNSVSTCSNSTGDSQIICGFARTGLAPNPYTPLAYDAVYVAAKGFADAIALNSSFSATPAEADQLLDVLYNVTHAGAGKYIEFNALGETHINWQYLTLNNTLFHSFGNWNGTATFTVSSITLPGGIEWYWNGIRFVPYKERSAIAINGNNDLISLAQSEKWLGDGSKSNPFIIKQYNITGSGLGSPVDPYNLPPVNMSDPYRILIEINNTDLYLKIQDNLLVGAGDSAIVLRNVTNAELIRNIATKSTRHAVRLSDSENLTAISNVVHSNGGIGLGLWFSNNSKIAQNIIYENGVNGIYTVGTRFNIINNNSVHNNIWHGIALDYYSENNSVLSNVVFENGREGIGFWDHSKYNNIEFNQIRNNNWDLSFGYGGIAGWDSSINFIENNVIENNTHGIYFASSNNTVISNNEVFNNSKNGIRIESSSYYSVIDNNNVFLNQEHGIDIFWANNNSISSNQIYANVLNGINVLSANYSKIIGNIIDNNNEYGITLGSSFRTEISLNTMHNNKMAGIFLSNAPWTLIDDNVIRDNSEQGIFMLDNSDYSQVTSNTVYGNLASGIDFVTTNFVSVTNNMVYQNNIGIFLEGDDNYFYIANNLVHQNGLNAEIQLLGNSDHNVIYRNDILESAFDQGFNNSFSNNHWGSWLSSDPYSFTGNLDQSPSPVPYHITAPTLTSPSSSNTFDNEVDIQWNSASDSWSHPLTYTIYYSNTNGASWQVITSSLTVTSFLWDVSTFANETMIQVKVHAVDDIGFESSSNINSFEILRTVEPPSSTPTTTTPPTTTPPGSTSKPSDSSTITTTNGLEILSILLSLFGIIFFRRKRK